jgi:hypothetical protein
LKSFFHPSLQPPEGVLFVGQGGGVRRLVGD